MKRLSRVPIVVVLVLLLVSCVPASANAWTASGFSTVTVDEDSFCNYDCESASARSDNVDWPVTFVFWGNATVAKVDAALSTRLPIWGVNEYFSFTDDPAVGPQWVANTGVKSLNLWKAVHMRLYGGGGVCLTNQTWGRYVIATCHLDINELSKYPTSGYSEDAATQIASMCRSIWGTAAVNANAFFMANKEPLRSQQRLNSKGGKDTHTWQCDGYATLVHVP